MNGQPSIQFYSLQEASLARGAVVVIDVLRAFTTAAYAFANGAQRIFPVGLMEEAFALKESYPGAALMGEVQGYQPEGFDYSNSPAEISVVDLSGVDLVQRTSAGTQGIIKSVNASSLMASSFVVARATAAYLSRINAQEISFVITGLSEGRDGEEDRACGEYIAALLRNEQPDPAPFLARVLASSVGQAFRSGQMDYLSLKDIQLSLSVNRFDFCMPVVQEEGRWVIAPEVL